MYDMMYSIMMSPEFWSLKGLVPRTENFSGKIGRPDQFLRKKWPTSGLGTGGTYSCSQAVLECPVTLTPS